MTADQIAERLHARSAGPDRWRGKCPVHGGRSLTSLSIARGDDGRTLLHCFAGCTTETICASVNLKVSDLFADHCGPQESKPPIVYAVERKIADMGLRSRLTPTERATLETIVILTKIENLDAAICRGLALASEGELCQIVLKEQRV